MSRPLLIGDSAGVAVQPLSFSTFLICFCFRAVPPSSVCSITSRLAYEIGLIIGV